MFKGTLKGQRLVDGVTMFIVTGLSLLLLVYVGFGEGQRNLEQFQVEKLTAQGRTLQNSIETFLRSGLPLKQFVGFTTLAEPIVALQDIDAMALYDQSGHQLFIVKDKNNPNLPAPSPAINRINREIIVDHGPTHYQVILPLRSRFETVGSLVVMSPTNLVRERLSITIWPSLYAALGLSVLFAIAVAVGAPALAHVRFPWFQIGYVATFLIMAGLVVASLIDLYSEGVQGKARASVFTMSQRLNEVLALNLDFKDFTGIDGALAEFRRANPEITRTSLIVDDVILVATNPANQGKAWKQDSSTFEYLVEVSRPDDSHRVVLGVSVPKQIVYQRIEASVRNFAALFVASAFMASLFLQMAGSMERLRSSSVVAGGGAKAPFAGESALAIVKPIFFLAVFLENLTYSFLPKFMQDAAVASGMSSGFASAPFTAYYLCFAASLIPAGQIADRHGPRPLIWFGLILSGASVLSLAAPLGILPLTVLRGLSGVGQGLLFIGIQAYILAVAAPEKKTQGAAIIVFGFQGGMIAGMAIGSLVVNYVGPQGVFMISGAIGCAMALYSILLIPRNLARKNVEHGLASAIQKVASELKEVVGNGEFLKTMFCIGVPAKAILTGTITFALPLLLGQSGYGLNEIGQIIMLYGIGVVAASSYAARLVDRTGRTDTILFSGAILSGLGLSLVGFLHSNLAGAESLKTILVVAGVMLVGVAHGFINAPVVTHVAHSRLATQIGANSVTTAYRFLERTGHIAGPFLVGQMFVIWGQDARIVSWIGFVTIVLGLVFCIGNARPRAGEIRREAVS